MIYNFYGETASGKDSVVRKLTDLGFKRIVSHTTRPPRKNEVNGVDYWFESKHNPDNSLCLKSYKVASGDTWYYWFDKTDIIDAINSKENYISISDVTGTDELNKLGATSIMIYADPYIRMERIYNRENKNSNPNFKEVLRRMISDSHDFKEVRHKALIENSIVWVDNIDIDETVENVLEIIEYLKNNESW